jgi:hypothetical protein
MLAAQDLLILAHILIINKIKKIGSHISYAIPEESGRRSDADMLGTVIILSQ